MPSVVVRNISMALLQYLCPIQFCGPHLQGIQSVLAKVSEERRYREERGAPITLASK